MIIESSTARSAPIRGERAQPLILQGGFTSSAQVLLFSRRLMKVQPTHYFRTAVSNGPERKADQPNVSKGASGMSGTRRVTSAGDH
jgi:hypothetical protein